MSWIPHGWVTERASGWWNIHHLVHESCGFRTANAYDLVLDLEFGGRRDAREIMLQHECDT